MEMGEHPEICEHLKRAFGMMIQQRNIYMKHYVFGDLVSNKHRYHPCLSAVFLTTTYPCCWGVHRSYWMGLVSQQSHKSYENLELRPTHIHFFDIHRQRLVKDWLTWSYDSNYVLHDDSTALFSHWYPTLSHHLRWFEMMFQACRSLEPVTLGDEWMGITRYDMVLLNPFFSTSRFCA